MDRVLSGATILGQGGPRSNGDEGVLRIPQTSRITGCLTIRLYSVISRTLVREAGLTLLQRCGRCILQPRSTGQNNHLFAVIWFQVLLLNINNFKNGNEQILHSPHSSRPILLLPNAVSDLSHKFVLSQLYIFHKLTELLCKQKEKSQNCKRERKRERVM